MPLTAVKMNPGISAGKLGLDLSASLPFSRAAVTRIWQIAPIVPLSTSAGGYYTGTVTSGIVLSDPALQNPTTIGAGGFVTNTTTLDHGDAVDGSNAAAWSITNLGTIEGNPTLASASGIGLATGGFIVNGRTNSSA